jgi:hypothetical protein
MLLFACVTTPCHRQGFRLANFDPIFQDIGNSLVQVGRRNGWFPGGSDSYPYISMATLAGSWSRDVEVSSGVDMVVRGSTF